MCIEDGNILEYLPWHADELRHDEADDGKHGDTPMLDVTISKKEGKTSVLVSIENYCYRHYEFKVLHIYVGFTYPKQRCNGAYPL